MLEPLVKTIEVPCSQREAFTVFVDEMHTWWPLAKFTVSAFFGAAARTLRVEAKVGGQIVEIGHDGKEHLWGTIEAYDPYDYLRTGRSATGRLRPGLGGHFRESLSQSLRRLKFNYSPRPALFDPT